jgi:hypothetical protein
MKIQQDHLSEENSRRKQIFEIVLISVLGLTVYAFSATFDILEKIVKFSWENESLEIDELLTVSFFLSIALLIFWIRRWKDLKRSLSEIKILRGIIPMCASCKKIRDDEGYWHQVEAYIGEHSEALFTHSICPQCMEELYPDFVKQRR